MSQPAVTDDSYLRTDVKPPKLGKGAVHKIYTFLLIISVHHMYCRLFFFAVISTAIEHCTRFLSLFLSLFSIPRLAYFPSLLLSFLASSTSTMRTFFYWHRTFLTFVAISLYQPTAIHLRIEKNPQPVSVSPFETFPSAFDRSYNFTGNGFEPVSFSIKILRFTLSY